MGLRVGHHSVHLFIRQLSRSGDSDLLLFAALLVFSRDGQDSVGVDVESDFDLRYASRSIPYSFTAEVAKRSIVTRKLALALKHVDIYRRLIVFGCRKDFRLAYRHRGVAFD